MIFLANRVKNPGKGGEKEAVEYLGLHKKF